MNMFIDLVDLIVCLVCCLFVILEEGGVFVLLESELIVVGFECICVDCEGILNLFV